MTVTPPAPMNYNDDEDFNHLNDENQMEIEMSGSLIKNNV